MLSSMASHPSLVFVGWNTRHPKISKFSDVSGPCHRNSNLAPKSLGENNNIVPSEDDPEDGVSLGTMKLPSDIDIARFEVLLFQVGFRLVFDLLLLLPMRNRIGYCLGCLD